MSCDSWPSSAICPSRVYSRQADGRHADGAAYPAGFGPALEPGAGKPRARICEGESRMAELLDHDLPYCVLINFNEPR